MLRLSVFFTLFFFAHLSLSGPIGNRVAPMPLTRRNSPKYVVAHFMVGNTYPYNLQNWLSDIVLAHQNGIDAFALNVGRDSWQTQQVANA